MGCKQSEDYYKVLGVDARASIEDIKRAYRALAKDFHPDKLQAVSDAMRRLAEEKFKEINEAYQVLSSPDGRQAYDKRREYSSEPRSQREASDSAPAHAIHELISKAGALIRTGNYPSAISLLKRAVREVPENLQIRGMLNDAKREWGQILLRRNY